MEALEIPSLSQDSDSNLMLLNQLPCDALPFDFFTFSFVPFIFIRAMDVCGGPLCNELAYFLFFTFYSTRPVCMYRLPYVIPLE